MRISPSAASPTSFWVKLNRPGPNRDTAVIAGGPRRASSARSTAAFPHRAVARMRPPLRSMRAPIRGPVRTARIPSFGSSATQAKRGGSTGFESISMRRAPRSKTERMPLDR